MSGSAGFREVASHFIGVACLVFLKASTAQAGLTLVESRAAFGANDHIDWGHLGPSGTTTTNPFGIESNGGIPVTVSQAGLSQFEVNVQVPLGSNPSDPTPNGYYGNFSPGDSILSSACGNGTGPLTLSFGSAISAVGTQIECFFAGTYTAQIEVFSASGTGLGSFTETGTSSGTVGDGSAIFIGVESTSENIGSVQFSLTETPYNGPDQILAINDVSFTSSSSVPDTYPDISGSSVPEPSSWVLLGISGAGGLLGFGRQKRNRPSSTDIGNVVNFRNAVQSRAG